MKVQCIEVMLDELHGNKSMLVDYSKGGMLSLGTTYVVYAMALWNGALNYLIVPKEAALPNWYPAELFSILHQSLPFEMYFSWYGQDDPRGLNAIWGYKELINDAHHYVELIERTPSAISTFLRRKAEIDAMS